MPICQKCGSPIKLRYSGGDLVAECGCTRVIVECLDKPRWKQPEAIPRWYYDGKPIEDYTREELIVIVKNLAERSFKDHAEKLAMLDIAH